MSFSFPFPAVPSGMRRNQATPVEPSPLWGTPFLLFVAALVAGEVALLGFGLENSRAALFLGLGVPFALFAMRAMQTAAAPAAAQASGATRSFSSNRAALVEIGNAMLAQSRRDDEPLSMIVFDQSDLSEMKSIFGAEAARQMVARIGATLHNMAGSRGFSVRTEATVFTVLMPGHDLELALASVRQALGETYAIEVGAQHDEMLLVPDFLARTVKSDVESIEDLYQSMRVAICKAQRNEQRRQTYLQRERESHSTRPALI